MSDLENDLTLTPQDINACIIAIGVILKMFDNMPASECLTPERVVALENMKQARIKLQGMEIDAVYPRREATV